MSTARAEEAPLAITEFHPRDEAAWEAFVERCPEATFFHRIGWRRILEEVFGHRTQYLCAKEGGTIRGVLPLAEVKSLLFGHSLVSTPFCVYGGAAAETEAARTALEEAACRLAESRGVDHLALRNRQARRPDWPRQDLYATFRKPLDPDPEANFRGIPRKQRAMVRKGMDAGLRGEIDAGVERLYPLYAESVRNLGTPVFPLAYFRALKAEFGADCEVLTITHQGRPVSSVLSFYFRDEVLPYYGGGTEAARDLKANDFMYWELMRRAAEQGVRVFDFGRSKRDTGSYRFKKHWGFEPEPLHYEYHLVRDEAVPQRNPLNPRYRFFIEAWKRLPVAVTRAVGPVLARHLG
jgi:FemAB-related protein (PEP-CTERM system-associated)